jgi:hypothetical protein
MAPEPNREQRARDTGMAAVLVLILVAFFTRRQQWLLAATGTLVLTMVWPGAFGPLSRLWFGLSRLLGTVVSKVVLTVLFLSVVLPMGTLRRLAGADPMRVNSWHRDRRSVLSRRDRRFTAEDLEKPF